jgi:hypothetical protein
MKISKEALTLHLYIYEEVLASLQWAIIHHNSKEAIFWGLELYDSSLMDDVFESLLEMWAQHLGFGKHCLAVLYNMIQLKECADLDREMWINSLYIWSNIRSMDPTSFQLLVRGSTIPSNWDLNFSHQCEYKSLDEAITNCLLRHKVTEAWLIGRALPVTGQWHILENICKALDRLEVFKTLQGLQIGDHVKLSICYVLATLSHIRLIESFVVPILCGIPEEIVEAIDDWDSEQSVRKRREYKVRPEALVDCSRVLLHIDESNLVSIQDGLERALMASPCWQVILEDYMDPDNTGQWKSDVYKEMFYDTYFPCTLDDIPDEWSMKDKEKSHGRGFGKTVQVASRQYINNMLRNKGCLGVYSPIQNVNDYASLSLEWDSKYHTIKASATPYLEAKLPFKPVVKVLTPLN